DIQCRTLACWCNARKHVSVTMRLERGKEKKSEGQAYAVTWENALTNGQFSSCFLDPAKEHVNWICRELLKRLFPATTLNLAYTGLIVVAGRTGSAKSLTARGLVHGILTDRRFCSWWR